MSTRACNRCSFVEDKRSLVRLRFRQDSAKPSWRACAVCATEVYKDIEAQAKEIAKLAKEIAVVEGEERKVAEDLARRSLRLHYENMQKARTKYDAAQKCAAEWAGRLLSSTDGGDLDPRSPEEERLIPTLKKESSLLGTGADKVGSTSKKESHAGADTDKVGSIFKKESHAGADGEKVGSPIGTSAPVPASTQVVSLRKGAQGVLPSKEEESASRAAAVEVSTIVFSSSSDSEEPDGSDSDYALDSDVCARKRRKGIAVDNHSLGASSYPSFISVTHSLLNGKKILRYASAAALPLRERNKASGHSSDEEDRQQRTRALPIPWTAAEEESLRQEMEKYPGIDGARQGKEFWMKLADCDKFGGRSYLAIRNKWDRMESLQRKRMG